MLCNIFPTYLLFVRQFPLSKNIYFARIPPSIKKRCQYFYLDARPCDITVRRLRVRLFRFFAYLYSKEQLAIRRLARLLSCCISLSRPAFRFSNKTGGPGNQERKHVHSKIHFKIRFRRQPMCKGFRPCRQGQIKSCLGCGCLHDAVSACHGAATAKLFRRRQARQDGQQRGRVVYRR